MDLPNHTMSAYTGHMKNPFRKGPMHNLETTVAALTMRGEQLVAKRATAQLDLDKAIKARQHALLAGDLDDQRALKNLQGFADTAASTLTGIDDALTVLAHDKTEAEHQIKAEHERIKRALAADKLHKQVAAIEAALPIYLQKSRELADGLSEIDWHFETGQMASFIQSTMGQIEVAANFAPAEVDAGGHSWRSTAGAARAGVGADGRACAGAAGQDCFHASQREIFVTMPVASSLPVSMRMQRCRSRPHIARCAKVTPSRPLTRVVRSSVARGAVTSLRMRRMSLISMRRSRTASCSMPIPFSVRPTSRKSTVALKRGRSRSRFRVCDHA